MRRFSAPILLFLLVSLVLAACAKEGSATDAVGDYLKTRVSGDEDKLVDLSCADWEAQAVAEAAAFESVTARIDGLKCSEAGKDGSAMLVTCTGTLVIQYRGEDPREQALPDLTYRAVKEDGSWKMCGTQ